MIYPSQVVGATLGLAAIATIISGCGQGMGGPSSSPTSSLSPSPTLIAPSQEQALSADFASFRRSLMVAIQQRDAAFIRALVTDQTQWSYGGTLSLDSYTIDNPDSVLWQHLEKAVGVECSNDDSTTKGTEESTIWRCPDFTPAQHAIQPDRPVYSETAVAILARDVPIHAGPGVEHDLLTRVSYDYLPITGGHPLETFSDINQWTPVNLPDGRQGYVQNRYAFHSPTEFRVGFIRQKGLWRLHFLLPGDGN